MRLYGRDHRILYIYQSEVNKMTEKKGCTGCGDPNIFNPRTNLCEKCEAIFQDAQRPHYKEEKSLAKMKKERAPGNPVNSLFDVGEDLLNVAEHFGIEKKDVGKALLKTAMTGKFDLFAGQSTKGKNKFERACSAIKDIAWIPLAYIVTYQLLSLLILKYS